MTENRIPNGRLFDEMNTQPLRVKDSKLSLPAGPGLGIELMPEVLRANLKEGEPYWDNA
jgi:L-alanine-DL-glutamate epimerase-like enolase superfamily enzyme